MGLLCFRAGHRQTVENLWQCYVTKHRFIPATEKGAVYSSVRYVIRFAAPGMWPKTSLHLMSWQFCSDSSVVQAHLAESFAYLLYTSICYTGPIKCVLMPKRLCQHVHLYTNRTRRCRGSWASTSLWSEVRQGSAERERGQGWGTRVPGCTQVCLCVYVGYVQCVGVEGSRWLSIVLQISCQSTSSWPVGDTRGMSGRCERFESSEAPPCCFCQNKQNWGFER